MTSAHAPELTKPEAPAAAPSRRRRGGRSGSETRQTTRTVACRLTAAEHALVERVAAHTGRTRSNLFRAVLLRALSKRTDWLPPSKPAPAADTAELTRLLSEINRVGSNVNQVARQANTAGYDPAQLPAIAEARAEIAQIREALTAAVVSQTVP